MFTVNGLRSADFGQLSECCHFVNLSCELFSLTVGLAAASRASSGQEEIWRRQRRFPALARRLVIFCTWPIQRSRAAALMTAQTRSLWRLSSCTTPPTAQRPGCRQSPLSQRLPQLASHAVLSRMQARKPRNAAQKDIAQAQSSGRGITQHANSREARRQPTVVAPLPRPLRTPSVSSSAAITSWRVPESKPRRLQWLAISFRCCSSVMCHGSAHPHTLPDFPGPRNRDSPT